LQRANAFGNMRIQFHNEYHTPTQLGRIFADKLMLGTSAYFLARFLEIVFRTRRIALEGKFDNNEWISSSHEIFRLIEDCGGKFHINGMDNLTKTEDPVVIISNHMSILETMIFPGLIAPKRWVTFVVKDSLVTHPVFGPVMRSRNPIVLSRSNPREDLQIVMQKGGELLQKGCSIVIFPQSTRIAGFVPQEFNSIGVKLAARSHVPVIPVAIKTDFWRNGRIIKDLGPINRKLPIYMEFGSPMNVSTSGKEEHAFMVDFIASRMATWK
jgi:1-acyl-sn-glycerol-3-phosphate acyltransferase